MPKRTQPSTTRRRRRATTPANRRGEKLVARQRSPQLEDTVVDTVGEKEESPDASMSIKPQAKSNAEDGRSSSLSSPSQITPPSPWLAHRGPCRGQASAGSSGAENANDLGLPSFGTGMATNMGLREHRSQAQTILAEASIPAARTPPPVLPQIAQNYPPSSHRPAVAPIRAHAVALPTSMARITVEQQVNVAKRIIYYTQNLLSRAEKNPVLSVRDIREVSKGYWRNLGVMDNVAGISESFYKPQLQMRAAYLWAQNCTLMSHHDLVYILKLPPGFLSCWVQRWARL